MNQTTTPNTVPASDVNTQKTPEQIRAELLALMTQAANNAEAAKQAGTDKPAAQ